MTRRQVLVREAGADPETAELIEPGPPGDDDSTIRGQTLLGDPIEVVVDGWRFVLEVEDAERAALLARATRARSRAGRAGPAEIRAMIAGRVAEVNVVAGDRVEPGDALLVVEAMKMQNQVAAPRAGAIERVAVAAGQTIDQGDLLVVLAGGDA
jgi:biotin carboxyl carrier protein